MEDTFQREVLGLFVEGYLAGQTPSPCVRCNSRVKFGELLRIAETFGADAVASGHYARILRGEDGQLQLLRGVDREKDQSYFLFELTRQQLERVIFPLGEMTKAQVRALAAELSLPNAQKPDSQEVCFVPEGKTYREVLAKLAGARLPGPGEVVDEAGHVLGYHQGFVGFTVGQRRGLGVALGRRLYVVAVKPAENRVVVGEAPSLGKSFLKVREVNWLITPPASLEVEVQVRSRHRPQAAVVEVNGQLARVIFREPVFAPAPGQAAVFYQGERVVGGGFITRAW
ncbi:MAG: tRNA 2-thiouridine(34) synthase MnmA, partial [Thermoanaerobaculum sp.]